MISPNSSKTALLLLSLSAYVGVQAARAQGCATAASVRDTSHVVALLRRSLTHDSVTSVNTWRALQALDSAAVPALLAGLCVDRGSEEGDVAATAGLVLARLGKSGVSSLARAVASNDTNFANNARLALEPLDSTEDPTPYLVPLLSDPRPRVRGAAVLVLRLDGPNSAQAIAGVRRALQDRDSTVRQEAASKLYTDGTQSLPLVPELRAAMQDASPKVRQDAALALGSAGAGDSATVATLVTALRADRDSDVRNDAARALGSLGGAAWRAVPALVMSLNDENASLRAEAADALGRIGSDTTGYEPPISRALGVSLSDRDPTVRRTAASALRDIGVVAQRQSLEALRSKDSVVRAIAIHALGEQPATTASIRGLAQLLSAKDSVTRNQSIAALGGFGPDVLPHLDSIARVDGGISDGLVRVRAYLARVDSLPVANACYRLQLAKWNPTLPIGDDSIFSTPPTIVRLSRVKAEWFGSRHGIVSYVVLPTNGARMSVHGPGYWTPRTRVDSLSIVWTTGFSGLSMSLGVTRDTLSGSAETFWDFPRTQQVARVLGLRIGCQK